jgi:crotonobetainyl-CoA:carnitine CoA-transferase CaiB-like acyl-CoA transferase
VETPNGPIQALLPPVTVPGREPLMGPVPALGQHNEAIRAELDRPPEAAQDGPGRASGADGLTPPKIGA